MWVLKSTFIKAVDNETRKGTDETAGERLGRVTVSSLESEMKGGPGDRFRELAQEQAAAAHCSPGWKSPGDP